MSARLPQVKVAHAGAVATLTLARPAMHNALVPDLLLDLCVALEEIARRTETRAVILAAEGEAFSIGGDMRRFAREMSGPALETYAAELVGLLNQAILSLLRLPQPVVAAVHGIVTGGSIGLVLASDVVVAADDSAFKAHYASAGFTPDGGWTALMPATIGRRRAAACVLLNRTLPAAEALACGLVTQLVARDRVAAAAREAALRVAAAPPATMREGKRLLAGDLDGVERALEAERQRFVASIGSAEARNGVARFLRDFSAYPDEGAAGRA